jgi:hypothetical protein
MATDDQSIATDVQAAHSASLTRSRLTSRWALGAAAGAGALLGLLVGIFVGRATSSSGPKAPVSAHAESLDPIQAPPAPANTYRAALGRSAPPGTRPPKGLRRELTSDKRRVARIVGDAASVRLRLQPADGEAYELTAVAQLDGPGTAKLQASWDGQSLATWDLSNGWALYSSPIPGPLLAPSEHELVLTRSSNDAVVLLDTVAVSPVTDELEISMADASGHLVEGFSKPDAQSVWSVGKRSVVAGVLRPAAGPYGLAVRCAAYPPIAPVAVQVRVNGKDVGSASVDKKASDLSWAIPPDVLRAGQNELAFEYSQTGQPAKLKPGSMDERELSIRFFSIDLAPAN